MNTKEEILVSEQVLQVPYVYSAGPVASRFLVALRDEQKIYGLKCGACGKVHVPPRPRCGGCGAVMDDWVEVGPEGELVNFTVVQYHETTHPVAAPFAIGLVRLAGADTAITHIVRAPDLDRLRTGQKVRPVWAQERRGHILDLEGFEPVPA